MAEKTSWETFKAGGESVLNNVKALIHEGKIGRAHV